MQITKKLIRTVQAVKHLLLLAIMYKNSVCIACWDGMGTYTKHMLQTAVKPNVVVIAEKGSKILDSNKKKTLLGQWRLDISEH